ncbi:dephospho-CoA kinase [Streptococcus ovis]|uniref:dephospho-CoA kinase n=1 Tax=Streptococcus ovis TaxID=82806 RepID=UPI0003A63AFF|nr:dephospho-CoA kinase [Streptococcus ovis]
MSQIIGLTGGIASGKSTVVEAIRQAGYRVIDADQVVHDLQAKGGKLYQALLAHFGEEILDDEGNLNRPKLSQLIFSSPENLKVSSDLQNQIIREELASRRDKLAQTEDVFFMDIPLLIELGYQDWFDAIWLVYVEKETQVQRLMSRNGYSYEEANQRIHAQMLLEEKRAYADVLIDNNGSLADLTGQVQIQLQQLQ